MTENTITIPVELEGLETAQEGAAQLVEKPKEARVLTDALASDLKKLMNETRQLNAEDVAKEMVTHLREVLS